jgi:hypothetical protein
VSPALAVVVRVLCDPSRQEELAGDIQELYLLRRRRSGPWAAVVRMGLDLASAGLRQSRLRAWGPRQWAVAGALVATVLAGSAAANGPDGPYTITATDAAGTFTLELQHGAVLSATLGGFRLPSSRVVQRGPRLVLRGADAGRDLEIALTARGGIRWEGRRPPPVSQDAPIDLALAHQYLAELAAGSARDNGALWGVPLYGPMFFVDPATRYMVANEPDSAGLLTPRDGLFVGTLPPEESPANTAIRWSGKRWTMIMWPLPSDGYRRRQLGFHELFHRVQPDLRLEGADPASAHLGTRDGRLWTRLEWRALAEALIRRGDERAAAIQDALLFRARRRALFPAAAADERALEMNEGLSEYTGFRMSGLPGWVLADRAAVALMDRERQESLSRSFAYASGPAYGVLLDERGVSWRPRVTPRTDLGDLLREAYRIRLPDVTEADLVRRAARYDGGRVMTQETALAERMAAQEARLRALLIDGPTVTVPVASRFSYSFDPNGATPLAGVGTSYESARVTDEWGILTVQSGGVLMVREGPGIVRAVVPAPSGTTSPPMSGEGWRLELLGGWMLRGATRPGSWEVVRAQ